MANWVPTLQFISDGERVEEGVIGRITRSLAQRTDYLFSVQNELLERKQRLQIDGIPCASSVENYKVVFLNPVSSLLELADGAGTTKTLVAGMALNKRSVAGGFVCDVVTKGLVTIPASSLSTFVTENLWLEGNLLFLDADPNFGQVTFTEPSLSVPMGITLPQDTSGNYRFLVDADPYLNLKHRHLREVFTIDPGTSMFALALEPTLPNAVFAHVNGATLRFDDDNVGNFLVPGDPDFTVVGSTLTVYNHARFLINPIVPPSLVPTAKLVVWYSTPFGNNTGVTGLVAGNNITLSACTTNGAVATGVVTVNAVPNLKYTTDDSDIQHVRNVTVDPTDLGLIITRGKSVSKLNPGIGIYFTGDDNGQGTFTINARANRNTYELVEPESMFLLNAKQDFFFDKFHGFALEAGENEKVIAKFRVPEYTSETVKLKLVLNYLIDSQEPSENVQLNIGYQQLIDDVSDAEESLTYITSTIAIDVADFRKRKTQTIDLDILPVRDSTFILDISRTRNVLTDLYTGNFNILHTRLRILPTAV